MYNYCLEHSTAPDQTPCVTTHKSKMANTMTEVSSTKVQHEDGKPRLEIHRIYLKDVSFETPNSPAVFQDLQDPEIDMQINTEIKSIDKDLYEITLILMVTAKQNGKVVFLVEAHQAGLFTVQGFDHEKTGELLGGYCPNTLYPFARMVVTSMVSKGGFPQILLAPVNFDLLHQKHLQDVRKNP